MKNFLKCILSLVIILAVCVSALCLPASSYSNDVETSTEDMILVNTDTNTVVFSRKPDNKWYSGSLALLTTYLVALDYIEDPAGEKITIRQSFVDSLPYSDGCLDDFVDARLSAKDLIGIMLMTSGSDAAHALVVMTGLSEDEFVEAMNDKVIALGCSDTLYVDSGFSNSSRQHTTCRDLYRIYTAVKKTTLYDTIMQSNTYKPDGFSDDYAVTSEASILNSNSPYYFRYTTAAKYSYSEDTYEGLVMTTVYHDKTYFFAGLLGKHESERNVYADGKKLTTWAYLNLSDRKVINADNSIAKVGVYAGWGSYEMELHPFSSAYKTLPNDFDEKLLSYDITMPEQVNWPLYKGQAVGRAQIIYDTEKIEDVKLVSETDEGLGMLSDSARFGEYVWHQLLQFDPVTPTEAGEAIEATGAPKTEQPTEAEEDEEE